MARIDLDTIKRIDKEKYSVHTKVFTTYTIFQDYGSRYLQLDTYGRSDREVPGKISQSFQIDKETAEFLHKLLEDTFNIKSEN